MSLSGVLRKTLEPLLDLYFQIRGPRQKKQWDHSRVVAHRGDHKNFKENTIEAFRSAQAKGAWGFECDVRWTKDGVPVIHHDKHLGRVFSQPEVYIEHLSFLELKKIEPQIPSLKEVVEEFGGKMHLMLELKNWAASHETSRLQKTLQEIMKDLQPAQDFHWMSLKKEYFILVGGFPQRSWVSIAELNYKNLLSWSIENQIGGFTSHYIFLNSQDQKKLQDLKIASGVGFPRVKPAYWHLCQRQIDWIFLDDLDLCEK